ncbi:MAG: NADH-ubiquinone oxidoreductase-F iron-sulfur binding region domain-containing protein [Nitrospiria bacterium]
MTGSILLEGVPPGGSLDLEAYERQGGYEALRKAVAGISPVDLVDAVKRSGLRGRGGAGFSTGKKWEMALGKRGKVKYVCCNASEGEPGTLKDRFLIKANPHLIIEGVILAAYTVGADEAYIFLKNKFAEEYRLLAEAVEAARGRGYWGPQVLGSAFRLNLQVFRGPDAYIAGEETAMLESIEGRAPRPRQKPPYYPIQHGLFGLPTLVNNAETLANIPKIVLRGGEWFAKIGEPSSPGTMLFSLTGAVVRPGVYELPLGTPLRHLIEHVGGGVANGRSLKAVFPGGPSQTVLVPKDLDVPLDFDSLKRIGSGLGTAGVMVYDDQTCMLRVAIEFATFYQNGSCGQCPPCELGTINITKLVMKIEEGQAVQRDLDFLVQVFGLVRGRGYCDLISSAVRSVESTVKLFHDEYETHLREGACPFPR